MRKNSVPAGRRPILGQPLEQTVDDNCLMLERTRSSARDSRKISTSDSYCPTSFLTQLEGPKNPRAGHSTTGTNQASCPIDGLSLELQSHGKESVREPLTVHDAGECSEITHERTNHKSLVQLSSSLGQNAHSQRADVFCSRPFGRSRVQDAGNLQRNRQRNPLLKSSRPRRHF